MANTSMFTLRIFLENSGKLYIHSPGREDIGVYQCAAVNERGSDVETSHLYFAGKLWS